MIARSRFSDSEGRTIVRPLEAWLAHCRDDRDDDGSVPEYVEREFRRYLGCGILAHGFARARCGDCGHTVLIAFSGKGRGVCLSGNPLRMAEVAAHRVEHVFPVLPVRQWVLCTGSTVSRKVFASPLALLASSAVKQCVPILITCPPLVVVISHSPARSRSWANAVDAVAT